MGRICLLRNAGRMGLSVFRIVSRVKDEVLDNIMFKSQEKKHQKLQTRAIKLMITMKSHARSVPETDRGGVPCDKSGCS